MTKYICNICDVSFNNADIAFEHLVTKHADDLMSEYITED